MTSIYTIQPGDTLSQIAGEYGITLEQLGELNTQIDNLDLIFAGQQINVPAGTNNNATGSNSAPGSDPEWLVVAQGQLGEREVSGSDHNSRIVEYHQTTTLRATDDETPWCSSFVNWCFKEVGINGTNSAAARSWLRWGKKLSRPQRGCITVFSSSRGPTSGHVGFFIKDQGPHLLILGGNQQNSVNYSSYPKSRLLSFRWST